jgi:hypothetical protein
MMTSPIDAARSALLGALDELDQAQQELSGSVERVELVCIYSIGRNVAEGWEEIGGWASTPGPKWLHAAMLRRAADAVDAAIVAVDDEDDDA